MMRASIGSNSLLLKPHTDLWTLELDLYQEMNGIDSAFLEFVLAFGFVLNQLPGILLFICQVQFPSDFTQNSNVESPEINYLPCSISTALPLQAFYLPLTLHQVPQHFLENSWSLQRKCYTRKSDLPCVIHPTSR